MRDRVLRGLAWKVLSLVVTQGSKLVVAIILARLLAPRDYGVAGMVLVFSSLVLVFSDLGLGAAIVQRKVLTEDDRSTVFWTNLGAGVAFTLVGIAVSGPIAQFYGQPQVENLFRAMSLSFVITAAGAVQTNLLVREMRFRSLELRTMISAVVAAVVGVTAALQGYGAWAIILQQVTVAATSTVMLWVVTPWRPRLRYSLASLREIGGFSANVFGTRVLFYLNGNADNMLVGRVLGAAALGAYSIAFTIILAPFTQIATPIQQVLFPALARMQDDRPRMAAAWLRVNRLVGSLSVPALVGMTIVAPDFVQVVLGPRWQIATPVIQILGWVGLLQSLQRLNSTVLLACDRTTVLFRYSVVVTVASLAAFVGGLHWGLVGVALAYAASSTVVEPYYTWLTTQALGISMRDLGRSLRGVIEASALMGVVVLLGRWLLIDAGVPTGARLGAVILLGIATYVPACWWREPALEAELRGLIGHRRRPAPVVAPAAVD